jgi:hypothetical protein
VTAHGEAQASPYLVVIDLVSSSRAGATPPAGLQGAPSSAANGKPIVKSSYRQISFSEMPGLPIVTFTAAMMMRSLRSDDSSSPVRELCKSAPAAQIRSDSCLPAQPATSASMKGPAMQFLTGAAAFLVTTLLIVGATP